MIPNVMCNSNHIVASQLLGRKLDMKDELIIQDANVILLLFELLPQLSETAPGMSMRYR